MALGWNKISPNAESLGAKHYASASHTGDDESASVVHQALQNQEHLPIYWLLKKSRL